MALLEETTVDPNIGRVTNPNIAEYLMPVNADVPDIRDDLHRGGGPAGQPGRRQRARRTADRRRRRGDRQRRLPRYRQARARPPDPPRKAPRIAPPEGIDRVCAANRPRRRVWLGFTPYAFLAIPAQAGTHGGARIPALGASPRGTIAARPPIRNRRHSRERACDEIGRGAKNNSCIDVMRAWARPSRFPRLGARIMSGQSVLPVAPQVTILRDCRRSAAGRVRLGRGEVRWRRDTRQR